MRVIRVVISTMLLVGCLAGAAFVVWDTAVRGTPSSNGGSESTATSTTIVTSEPPSGTPPKSAAKNPFIPVVQLPGTATTQPPP